MSSAADPLPQGFPSFELGPSFGRWWRYHRVGNSAWYFASSDALDRASVDPEDIGRFDLSGGFGTCYLGEYAGGTLSEVLRETGVAAAAAQEAANERRMSAMAVDCYYGRSIADFTSGAARYFGLPVDFDNDNFTRARSRPFAEQAVAAGFVGVLYRLHQDPEHRLGLALFGNSGPLDPEPSDQPAPTGLPAGLRNELRGLFKGEYRGDPIPK